MKKHSDAQSKNKLSHKTGIIIVVFVALVLATTFILTSNDPVDYSEYNGFEFEKQGEIWQTLIEVDGEPFEVPFYYHPLDVEPILYDDRITDYLINWNRQVLYVTFDPDSGSVPVLAGVNIVRVSGQVFGLPATGALTSDPSDSGQPIVSCANATPARPVMYLESNASITGAYFDDENTNCIIVSGTTDDELIRISDIVSYKLLGILESEQ